MNRESDEIVPGQEKHASDPAESLEPIHQVNEQSPGTSEKTFGVAHEKVDNTPTLDRMEKSKPSPGDEELPPLKSRAEIKTVIEALLFATTEPLSIQRLAKILAGVAPSDVRQMLFELQQEYDAQPRGLCIVEVAGGFQMATRPHLAPWIYRLKPSRRRQPLSQATLETLAIVAYKQPITRAEIEAIRGVDSSATLHTLLELGLIDVGGRREVPGRPQLYVTTQQFLKVFGLKSLGDLPSIHELRRQFALEPSAPKTPAAAKSHPQDDTKESSGEESLFSTEKGLNQERDDANREMPLPLGQERPLNEGADAPSPSSREMAHSFNNFEEDQATPYGENPT